MSTLVSSSNEEQPTASDDNDDDDRCDGLGWAALVGLL